MSSGTAIALSSSFFFTDQMSRVNCFLLLPLICETHQRATVSLVQTTYQNLFTWQDKTLPSNHNLDPLFAKPSPLNESTCSGEARATEICTQDVAWACLFEELWKAMQKYLNDHTVQHTMRIKHMGQLDSYLNETQQQRSPKTKRLDAWESYGPAIVTALLLSK